MGEKDQEVLELGQQLASSGFRDTSRVGGGNPELGVMMARYNRQELLSCLRGYGDNLEEMIAAIEKEDWSKLEEILEATKKGRSLFIDS